MFKLKSQKALGGMLALLLGLAVFQPAGATVKSFRKDADGVTFVLNKGLMKIRVCLPDLIQVKYTALSHFPAFNSLVVNNAWAKAPGFKVSDGGNKVVISTSRLKILIDKATEAVTYTDINNKIITAETGKSMEAQTVAGINTYSCTTRFQSPAGEGLFGLGCHPLDSLSINYKGRNQDMAIKYLTGAIPVMLSTKGYGLLWDNYSASNFYGAENNNTEFSYVSESGRQVNYYFFYGPGFDHIISLYRTATGKAPMYPKWSMGLFQSQDRYLSQDEIIGVKNQYRNKNIPVDAIVQDWYYWDPLPIGSHVMKHERYPNPKALVDELHKAHLHAMISIWPVFGKGTPNYDALDKAGFLTSITWDNVVTHTFDTYYDAHNPKARDMYWQQARDSLVKRYGWDAWWVDQCEPDNGALLDERRKANFSVGKGIDYFNTYSLEHTKGLYKGWRKDIPNKRPFFLVRQAFAGQQRNAATLWSSDIPCTFASFKKQVPQGINTGVSGIPFWTSDIGGYHYNWTAPNWALPENRELFTRWFQFGAFCPVFRIHGKGERALFSSNWDDRTKDILLKYDELRYRLMPYIYSLNASVYLDNYTMMRSLAFDFRNDKNVYDIPDQYLLGPAFMVSPVTAQLYTGAGADSKEKSRKVYLPAGTAWYDFWTGDKLDGGNTINAAAPIQTIPLYVKAGSIVPMGPVMQYATEKCPDVLELRIYPGANGQFKLYEDENDTYNYTKGQYATISMTWNDATRTLGIAAVKGHYPGMLTRRKFNVVLVQNGHGGDAAQAASFDKTITYTGKAIKVKL